ncbi:MAG: hypothetical protein U9R02_01890 [Thermodesulfobacteriota bacterium]|nr:hypothetical protein [Thermodesulfobacteriota bacterium]
MTQGRVAQIINNTNFGEINNLLSQGHDMEYIARHYNMDFALVWALRLEGKTDQEKFKELGWGLRTWDQWYFNECDERFGDDWPARHRSRPKEMVSASQGFRSGEAGGRDFESTPASKEKPDKSITIFDYHRLLSKTGWEVTHLSACGTHRQVE